MFDYKKILFPVDLSDLSVKIYPHVKSIADKLQAEVQMMFVAKVNEYFVEDEEEGASVKEKIKAYKDKNFKDVHDSQIVATGGDPADEILSYIESEDIDLVIMATRGRTALDKALFGSVAGKVARIAPVPVLLVNPYKDKLVA